MGGLFPSAAYRRSAPPQVARGGLNQCKLQCRGIAWMVLQSRRTGLFFFCGWRYPYANNVAWDTSIIGFLQRKRPAGFHIHAGLFCEPRGLSPNGGLCYSINMKPHQTGEPWHLSCHGGKTRPACFSSSSPAPYGRGVGCRALALPDRRAVAPVVPRR